MLKFLVIILLVAIYVAVSYWLISKQGFDTAREYAQYLMQNADGYFAYMLEECQYRYGEQWIRRFTVVYCIEIVLLVPVISAWFAIKDLFKR